MLKTKEVSQVLGVNPTTVQRWVKYFNLPCQKNEHGHYLFDDKNLLQLKEIKSQLNLGLPMSQVKITHLNDEAQHKPQRAVDSNIESAIKRFETLAARVEKIEYQLEEKATNVVNIQLLQHRRELEKLYQLVENLKREIEEIKTEQQKKDMAASEQPKQRPQRSWFASFLNMLS